MGDKSRDARKVLDPQRGQEGYGSAEGDRKPRLFGKKEEDDFIRIKAERAKDQNPKQVMSGEGGEIPLSISRKRSSLLKRRMQGEGKRFVKKGNWKSSSGAGRTHCNIGFQSDNRGWGGGDSTRCMCGKKG